MTRFQNSQVSCLALGLALSEGECFFASAAGPATAAKSIWASLVSNNSGVIAAEWYSRTQSFNFASQKKGEKAENKTLWANISDSTYRHFVTIRRDPNIILLINPSAAGQESAVDLRLQQMPEVYFRFYLWLKNNFDVPVLKEWSQTIWEKVTRENESYVKPMLTWGDCVGGWKLTPDTSFWTKTITEMVAAKEIIF